METKFNTLKLVHLGIDTQKRNVSCVRTAIYVSPKVLALNRVLITLKGKSLYTLYIITNGILQSGKVDHLKAHGTI
jgi:thymidine phosphorylase